MTVEVYTATEAQRNKYEGHIESDGTAERVLRFANYSGKWYISTSTPEHFPSIAFELTQELTHEQINITPQE